MKVHLMRWAVQDYLTSKARNRSIVERDPWLSVIHFDILNKLHEAGGYLPLDAASLAYAILRPREEIERCLPILIEFGTIVVDGERIYNQRVLDGLADTREWIEAQAKKGKGRASKAPRAGGKFAPVTSQSPAGHQPATSHAPAVAGEDTSPPPATAGESASLPLPLPMPMPMPMPKPMPEPERTGPNLDEHRELQNRVRVAASEFALLTSQGLDAVLRRASRGNRPELTKAYTNADLHHASKERLGMMAAWLDAETHKAREAKTRDKPGVHQGLPSIETAPWRRDPTLIAWPEESDERAAG